MKRTQILRKTPLRSRAEPLRRTRIVAKNRNDTPASVRKAVMTRSGGVCEACGLYRATDVHHRRMRSQGGRHDPANCIAVDRQCHSLIHAQPARSYALGLLVRSGFDPADVPVRRFGEGPGELIGHNADEVA